MARPSPNRIALSALLSLALLLGSALSAAAQELRPEIAPVFACEAPISTCQELPVPLGSDVELAPSFPPDDCPAGYACTCVPSRPGQKDCAAQVCVRDPGRECKTACDCPTGLGCWDGQCIAGVAPVYCCDSDRCEPGAMCQASDGSHGICPRVDAMCQERREKVNRAIQQLVESSNQCRRDSDCVQIGTSTQCNGTCGAWVNKRRARRVSRLIDRYDAAICDGFVEGGCPFVTPACLATRGACVRNRCEGVPIVWPPPDPILLEPTRPLPGDAAIELAPLR